MLQVGQKLCLILQVRIWSGRRGIERRRTRVICVRRVQKWRVLREIREWLVVELENDVGIVRRVRIILECRVPATGVPFPADPGVIETIAYGDDVS